MNLRAATLVHLGLAGSLLAAACSRGGDASPTATAAPTPTVVATSPSTPTASPEPTPTEAPVTPQPTTTGTPAPSATATATATPTPVATAAPSSRDVIARAYYRLALTARDGGDLETAVERFRQARDVEGPLAPIAALRLAQTLLSAERYEEGAEAFSAALADPELPGPLQHVTGIEYGDVLVALDRIAEALAQYDAAAGPTIASTSEAAAARWRSANARRSIDDPLWTGDALAVVALAPGSASAVQALDALEEVDEAVPSLQAAYVRYLNHDDPVARERYEEIAATSVIPSEGAIAWFYLGALAERSLDNPTAIEAYERSLELDPVGYLADDLHWWLALLYEDVGQPQDALAHYDALSTSFAASSFTRSASLGSALSLARSGDGVAAATRLRALMAEATPSTAATAARWLSVLDLREEGDLLPADFDPSALASVLEATSADTLAIGATDEWRLPDAGWDEALGWMDARFGPRSTLAARAVESDRFALASELLVVGERDVARAVLFDLVADHGGRPHELLDIARAASHAGVHDIALVAAIRILGPLDPLERAAAPLAIELLAYPAPFPNELLAAAEAEGVPPLLLLALVRQESAFNPEAGSPAGALGLTQVIPPTGAQIAASLEVRWHPDLLYEPASSLRFGAHYLATQLELFEGDLLAALAAYNAGPTAGRTLVWPAVGAGARRLPGRGRLHRDEALPRARDRELRLVPLALPGCRHPVHRVTTAALAAHQPPR